MERSLKIINCSSCYMEFSGFLEGYFNVCVNYSAKCPQCGTVTAVNNDGAFISSKIPDDAVLIKEVSNEGA